MRGHDVDVIIMVEATDWLSRTEMITWPVLTTRLHA